MKKYLLLLALLVYSPLAQAKTPIKIDLPQLVKSPQKYHGKTVRVWGWVGNHNAATIQKKLATGFRKLSLTSMFSKLEVRFPARQTLTFRRGDYIEVVGKFYATKKQTYLLASRYRILRSFKGLLDDRKIRRMMTAPNPSVDQLSQRIAPLFQPLGIQKQQVQKTLNFCYRLVISYAYSFRMGAQQLRQIAPHVRSYLRGEISREELMDIINPQRKEMKEIRKMMRKARRKAEKKARKGRK